MLKIFMVSLLLLSQVAWAAETPQQQTEDQGSEETALDTGLTPEAAAAGESDDLVPDNEGNEQEAEEERKSSGRFIPTEQISQDLGVSFPVDI